VSLDQARALDAADPLAFARERFRFPDDKTYLDGNSLGMMPASAPERVARTVEREWGEGLIESWNEAGWIDWPERIAARLAPIVGARADELLVCDSTSINIAKLLGSALAARPERRVVLVDESDFPTDRYIAAAIAEQAGGELRAVSAEAISDALTDEVAVLLLSQVDYRSGRRRDLSATTADAQRVGAIMLWDLSHSAGAIRVDLATSGAEMAVGCGYKYLNGGPGAPAWLYVRRDLQQALGNPLPGWMGHARPFEMGPDYVPAPGIRRFLTGTPPIVALAALEAGLETFEGLGMAAVEAKAAALADFFIEAVEVLAPEATLASPLGAADRGAHLVFAHRHAYAIVQALIARGVIGDYREPNLMRFGFAPLTTRFEDAWRAAAALGEVIAGRVYEGARFAERRRVT